MFLATAPYFIQCHDVLRSIVRKQNTYNGKQCSKHFGHIRLEEEAEEETSYSQLYTAFSTNDKESSIIGAMLNFWHRSIIFNSNKSPTRCNNFPVYFPDVHVQLNMFRAFSRPSSKA